MFGVRLAADGAEVTVVEVDGRLLDGKLGDTVIDDWTSFEALPLDAAETFPKMTKDGNFIFHG